MFKWFCLLMFKLKGWKVDTNVPVNLVPSVVIAAPHTSNWDLIMMTAAWILLKVPSRFTIKKEWMRFPWKKMMRSVGAIPIDRSPRKAGEERLSMVEAMADLFKTHSGIVVVVTPEGTRSLRTEWKTGFYHVARLANVPIALGYLDYENKTAGIGKLVYVSDNMEADLREIMSFYKNIKGQNPEKFSVDLRYE